MRKRCHRSRAAVSLSVRGGRPAILHERTETGIGRLEVTGQDSLTLPYLIEVGVRCSEDSGGRQWLEGRQTSGRVIPPEAWTLVPYVGAAILVLEDGRRWECRVVDIDGQLVDGAAAAPFVAIATSSRAS